MSELGLTKEAVKALIDDELMDEVVAQMLSDPQALDNLAEQVASDLADTLKDDPTLKEKMIKAATQSPELKKRIIGQIVKGLKD